MAGRKRLSNIVASSAKAPLPGRSNPRYDPNDPYERAKRKRRVKPGEPFRNPWGQAPKGRSPYTRV